MFLNEFLLWEKMVQKGGEAINSASVDGDIAEAEGGIEGSLQEEEVSATGS